MVEGWTWGVESPYREVVDDLLSCGHDDHFQYSKSKIPRQIAYGVRTEGLMRNRRWWDRSRLWRPPRSVEVLGPFDFWAHIRVWCRSRHPDGLRLGWSSSEPPRRLTVSSSFKRVVSHFTTFYRSCLASKVFIQTHPISSGRDTRGILSTYAG